MWALHQVATRRHDVRRGAPVFTGTRVPLGALLDHLDQGGDLDGFLARHPSVPRNQVLAACALGLEALVAAIPVDRGPSQRSLLPRVDAQGVIVNAEELSARVVIGKRVLCPACRELRFKAWPEGWDGHAAFRCRGLPRGDQDDRKAEYRRRYSHLFAADRR